MPNYEVVFFFLRLTWLLFVVAFGCCVGSLINVIVYRMPRGISIVTPPSRCPSCNTRLTFRENIPVLGWLILRGRCRYCKAPISPEYPIVEASVGALFGLFFLLWYVMPADWLGVHWASWRPEWALNDWTYVWPIFVVVLTLLGSLAAMTIVDARTSTIPLALCWFPTIIALLAHPAAAAWVQGTIGHLPRTARSAVWSIPTPSGGPDGWRWVGLAVGACLGLVISNALLRMGLIRRSFADYDEWERSRHSPEPTDPPQAPAPPATEINPVAVSDAPPVINPPAAVELATAVIDPPPEAAHTSPEAAPQPAEPAAPDAPPEAGPIEPPKSPEDVWIQYPHARREMWKELTFLAPAAGLAWLGWHAVGWAGLTGHPAGLGSLAAGGPAIPLWLQVLTGVLLGYLIGGGVVWAVRISGSLGFGREAMGLGDVHLMAAVGACVGWIDSTLAFFGAAFVGLFWAVLGRVFSGFFRRAMPYGPFLAIATALVLLLKPLLEAGLSILLKTKVDLP